MIARLVKVLMLSAAVLAGGPIVIVGGTQAVAAAQNAPVRLTAAQMLDRQGIAVTVISKSYTALPKEARGRSAPFLKGLIDVANAYRDVAAASKARDNRKMGAALPKVATSLAKLNSAYQLSGIHDPKIEGSLKSLNVLWKTYLKVVNVAAPHKSDRQAVASARRITKMRHELMRRGAGQKADQRAAAQRAHLLALLREADAASRQADQLWYASMLMAEVYGYYAGAYEYYVAYEPAYAVDYRESWQSVSTTTEYFYSESVSYYEEYSWSSYEETVEVSESYEFGLTEEEFTAAEAEVETSGVSAGEEAESLYQSSEERQTLESVETKIDAEEAAATEAPEPDAAAQDTADDQPADANETPQTDEGGADQPGDAEGGADGVSPDDSCGGDTPSQDCAAAPAEDGAQDEAAPDEPSSQDETAPDEANSDESSPDEAAPDDGSAPDENAGQSNEDGDACAGDNPPADCFSSDEGEASDDGAAAEESGGDDQSYDEPAQDDAAVQEDSSGDDTGGADDSSGGDDSGGDSSEEE